MSLNSTVSADRIHISFFGNRNVGKSSLVNAITGQSLSVVSDVLGTTTDPVKKAMELLPLGPVLITDTPGFDDVGALGQLRVQKTRQILAKTDIAVLVRDCTAEITQSEQEFLTLINDKKIPLIIAHNKADLLSVIPNGDDNNIWVSAEKNININEIKQKIGSLSKVKSDKKIVSDMLEENDIVVLVTPIDAAAPKGRLILPQQQVLRDIIDKNCTAVVCQTESLKSALNSLKSAPKMVITDSQAFFEVGKIVPSAVPLTSFSILFARYKGDLITQVDGARTLSKIKSDDKILISEGCTHHRQCGDIGTVKLPKLIKKFTGAQPQFTFTSGGEFPEDLSEYKLVIHCGGCMLNEAEMKHRIKTATNANVPIVNYGVAIAHMNGILSRSISLFPDALKVLEDGNL